MHERVQIILGEKLVAINPHWTPLWQCSFFFYRILTSKTSSFVRWDSNLCKFCIFDQAAAVQGFVNFWPRWQLAWMHMPLMVFSLLEIARIASKGCPEIAWILPGRSKLLPPPTSASCTSSTYTNTTSWHFVQDQQQPKQVKHPSISIHDHCKLP